IASLPPVVRRPAPVTEVGPERARVHSVVSWGNEMGAGMEAARRCDLVVGGGLERELDRLTCEASDLHHVVIDDNDVATTLDLVAALRELLRQSRRSHRQPPETGVGPVKIAANFSFSWSFTSWSRFLRGTWWLP